MNTTARTLDWFLVIAEDEDGGYEPVALASTFAEAEELARSDYASRLRRLERDEEPGLCPYLYRIWARREDRYEPAGEVCF
ncbi:MAG: hypothetical protein NZM33_16360 [Bryobacteraceae bacterium]|nr:hypothetical protein [Bryobacteraceae bacterium]